jgi:acyl carrier protein
MNALELLIDTVDELIDVDIDLNAETKIEDMGLVSLDYIEIQVVVKKAYGLVLRGDLFETGQITTLGEFADYIDNNKS